MDTSSDVAVIGAGTMGAGIAQVLAAAGHTVHLVDPVGGAAARGIERTRADLAARVAKGRLAGEDLTALIDRLHPLTSIADLPECAVVIEATPEDPALKQRVLAELEATQPPTAVLATNTSSLSLDALAQQLSEPERFLGLHFFNPAPAMRLVEVIRSRLSAPAYLDYASGLVRAWGKVAVHCTSTPGFIVNRVARPFYGEAQRMRAEAVADPATLDWCIRAGGFRMGPFQLTDLIGQDVNLAVGTSVWEQTDHDPRYEPTQWQRDLVAAGHLGRKSRRGVFEYAADGTLDLASATPDETLGRRLLDGPVTGNPLARTLAMLVNEAVDLVHRGEATGDDVDTAMRLGTGYPQGPIEWGYQIGFDVVADQLAQLDAAYPGGRYRPSRGLADPPVIVARTDD